MSNPSPCSGRCPVSVLRGDPGWPIALCMNLEHRAPAALPPASGGLEEVTPKMSAHKYHLNLIT